MTKCSTPIGLDFNDSLKFSRELMAETFMLNNILGFMKKLTKARFELEKNFSVDVGIFVLEVISLSTGMKVFWEKPNFIKSVRNQLEIVKKYLSDEDYKKLENSLTTNELKGDFDKICKLYEEKIKNAPKNIKEILKL